MNYPYGKVLLILIILLFIYLFCLGLMCWGFYENQARNYTTSPCV